MSDISIDLGSREVLRLRRHFLVTILTLVASILIFVPAYFLSRNKLSPEQDLVYLLLLIAALIAFNLFFAAVRMNSFWELFPFVTLVILFLVSYYLKYWQITLAGQAYFEEWRLADGGFSSTVLLRSFEIISVGFVTFCLTAILYIAVRPLWKTTPLNSQDASLTEAWRKSARALAIFVPILAFIVLFLLERYNIGIRGYQAVRLPFRLSGIIYYTSVVVVPATMLLLVHASIQSKKPHPLRYPLVLIVGYYLILTLLFASRGNFLYGMLALFVLLFSYPEYRRRSVILLIISAVISILLFSSVTHFRFQLVAANGQTLNALNAFLNYGPTQTGDLVEGTQNALLRVTGANSLMLIASRLPEPVGLRYAISNGLDLGDYYTHMLLGFSEKNLHRAAPSLFGWFYLAGELWLVCIGVAVFTLVTGLIWDVLHKLKENGWLAIRVIQALFVASLFQIAMDGGLHRIWEAVVVMAGTMILATLIVVVPQSQWLNLNRVQYQKESRS